MATNNNIATVRTVAPVTWATGVTLLVEWLGDLDPATMLFIMAASTVVIHRIGVELQGLPSRVARVIGDILLWQDKVPVYETPPAPERPNP